MRERHTKFEYFVREEVRETTKEKCLGRVR